MASGGLRSENKDRTEACQPHDHLARERPFESVEPDTFGIPLEGHDKQPGAAVRQRSATCPREVIWSRVCRGHELRHIATLRNFDAQARAGTFRQIVTLKFTAQPSRFDPHDRITLGVEILSSTKCGCGDRIGLDTVRPAGNRLFDDKTSGNSDDVLTKRRMTTQGCVGVLRARERPTLHHPSRLHHHSWLQFRTIDVYFSICICITLVQL